MLALLVLILLLQPAPQAEAERLFHLGNALYAEGDLRGSAAAYEGALATGWTSTALLLNLSGAYAGAGEAGRAVLYAERARRLAPRDEDVHRHLEALHERLGLEDEAPARADAVAAWLSARLGAGGLAAVLLAVFLGALALAAVRVWTGRPSPWRRRALGALAVLGLGLAVLTGLTARFEARPRAVAMAAEVPVRAAPSAGAAEVARLPEGRLVALGARRGPWQAVRLAGGGTGWAEAASLAPIP